MNAQTSSKLFDAKAERYAASKTNSWDRLRYDVWTANIEKHVSKERLRVLDAGGGDGLDTLIWARKGHEVTLLDSSPKMLEEAKKRIEAEELEAKVTFHEASLAELPSLGSTFDLILCHNVLPYLDDVSAALEQLKSATKAGGILSVICLNQYSEPFRQAVQQMDTEAALRTLNSKTYTTAAFGVPVTLFTADEMTSLANEQGLRLAASYGVRCANDYIPNDVKRNYEEMLRLELALTGRHPYYLLARFFQLILKKESS